MADAKTVSDVQLGLLIERAGELRAELLGELRAFLEAHREAHGDQPRTGRAGDTRLALGTAAEFAGRCVEALTVLRASRATAPPVAPAASTTSTTRKAYDEGVGGG